MLRFRSARCQLLHTAVVARPLTVRRARSPPPWLAQEASKDSVFTVENRTFYRIFPFHLLMDDKLKIVQARCDAASRRIWRSCRL